MADGTIYCGAGNSLDCELSILPVNPALSYSTTVFPDGGRAWSFVDQPMAGPATKYDRRNQYSNMGANDRTAALAGTPTCGYCGTRRSNQADHIYPVKAYHYEGGWALSKADRSDEINQQGNLVGACSVCNGSGGKSGKVLGTGPGPPAWPVGVWWPFGGGPLDDGEW